MPEFRPQWTNQKSTVPVSYRTDETDRRAFVSTVSPIAEGKADISRVCATCGAELKPTVAAYGLARCTVHMTEPEYRGWLIYHRDHWHQYYDPKAGQRTEATR